MAKIKKGAVDLSAFHGTQGRRIVTLEYTIENRVVFQIRTNSPPKLQN
jgi:hypothetical protein